MNDVLNFAPQQNDAKNDSHDLWMAEETHENLSYFAQKANGLEFDEEIEEFEEQLDGSDLEQAYFSHENLFLFIVMAIVIIFAFVFGSFVRRR